MIKANELRIGNWVYTQSKKLMQHDKTVPFKLKVITAQEQHKWEPIPLTPKILEKCGFVKDAFGSYNIWLPQRLQTAESALLFSGDYLYLGQYNDDNRNHDSICTFWNKDLMKEFHLHQLQNLYFSLTGEELEIAF